MALTRKQIMADYYRRNKKSILEKTKSYRLANTEKVQTIKADWYQRNKDKVREHRQLNKHAVNAKNAEYRARKFRATIPMTKEDKAKIAEVYKIAKDATNLFGYRWVVDHIVPLNKGGLHKLSNLQVVPEKWNLSKKDLNNDNYWVQDKPHKANK